MPIYYQKQQQRRLPNNPRTTMIALTWNCQGLGSLRVENALRDTICIEHPNFVFLSETKLKGTKKESVKRKLNYYNFLNVDCDSDQTEEGRLCHVMGREFKPYPQVLFTISYDFVVTTSSGSQWRLIGVYGLLEEERKHDTQRMLVELGAECTMPWLCLRDFNSILNHDKMWGEPEESCQRLMHLGKPLIFVPFETFIMRVTLLHG